jgi:hypothetical protein
MTGVKTSIWLKPESHERWKATGLSLADIVDRGLDAGEPDPLEEKIERLLDGALFSEAVEARIRRIVSEELGALPDEDTIRRIVRDAIEHAAGMR